MAESVPRVELYTGTILESSLVRNCVHDFYVSILRFWTQACKFYQRRRLCSIFSAAWCGYDAGFPKLELEMDSTVLESGWIKLRWRSILENPSLREPSNALPIRFCYEQEIPTDRRRSQHGLLQSHTMPITSFVIKKQQ